MATVTGYTAARMKIIEDAAIISGVITGDNLILTRHDGTQVNAGNVRGPQGNVGPVGPVPEAPISTTVGYIRRNSLWTPGSEAPLRDTLVNLNTNNPVVPAGRRVEATDAIPFRFAVGDGATAWSNLPKFFERVTPQQTVCRTSQGVSSAVYVDRTGLTVTFTVGDVPWMVIGNETLVYCSTSAGVPVVTIRDGAGVIKESAATSITGVLTGGIYYGSPMQVIEIITTPGTYTRKLSIANNGSGTVTFGVTTDFCARLIARPL